MPKKETNPEDFDWDEEEVEEEVEEVERRFQADDKDITPFMGEYDIILTNNTEKDLERNIEIINLLTI